MALDEDPEAAKEIVMEDQCQSMPCYATEHECCSQILRELAVRGADFNTVNARGLAPLRIISEWTIPPCGGDWKNAGPRAHMEELAVRASRVAIAFGAQTELCGPDGKSAIDVAASRGATQLERFLIEWPAVRASQACAAQACAVLFKVALKREHKQGFWTGSLPGASLRIIGKFLILNDEADAVLKSVEKLVLASA